MMAARKKPTHVPHTDGHCPVCEPIAKLPWLVTEPEQLIGSVDSFVHELVSKVADQLGFRIGVVVTVFSETHHATTGSNVPDEWLESLGRELIRTAQRRTAASVRHRNELN